MNSLPGRGLALVIAAPSGAGKTSLARALVDRHDGVVEFSISATTRQQRRYEQAEQDYHFVSDNEFDRMVAAGELLEWAVVHGRKYGTLKSEVEDRLSRGRVVVLDIDVQGARQVRAVLPNAVLVFVLPPSVEELGRRLAKRDSEAWQERQERLQSARRELKAAGEFDYIVVNDDFEHAVQALEAIIAAERCRTGRADQIAESVGALDRELERLLSLSTSRDN